MCRETEVGNRGVICDVHGGKLAAVACGFVGGLGHTRAYIETAAAAAAAVRRSVYSRSTLTCAISRDDADSTWERSRSSPAERWVRSAEMHPVRARRYPPAHTVRPALLDCNNNKHRSRQHPERTRPTATYPTNRSVNLWTTPGNTFVPLPCCSQVSSLTPVDCGSISSPRVASNR